MKKPPIDEMKLGILIGYLRSIEAPAWIEDILDELSASVGKKNIRRALGTPKEDEGGGEEETEEEDADSEKSTYDKFKELDDQGESVSDIASELGLSVQTVYQMRARKKKEAA